MMYCGSDPMTANWGLIESIKGEDEKVVRDKGADYEIVDGCSVASCSWTQAQLADCFSGADYLKIDNIIGTSRMEIETDTTFDTSTTNWRYYSS